MSVSAVDSPLYPGDGKFLSTSGPPSALPRLARRIVIGLELSSKMPASAASLVVLKSRMLGLPVAKCAASREKSTRWERSMFVECGSCLIAWVCPR